VLSMAEHATIGEDLHCALLGLFAQFGELGKVAGGGISRLAASDADARARDLLCDWLKQNKFDVIVDKVGNIFGILDLGQGEPGTSFFCGSHLDSQPLAGRFDGTYGVVCACMTALAVRNAVRDGSLTTRYRNFVVACWTSEEGARFQPSLLGSGVFVGDIDAEHALATTDQGGVALSEALSRISYVGTGQGPTPARYFEIHIEQGTRLETEGADVGLVTSCWGARKLLIAIAGRADHTGPTPMDERKDALLAASQIIARVNGISMPANATLHSSVGRITVEPNSPNTVAESASVWIEIRSGCEAALDQAEGDLNAFFDVVQAQTGCDITVSSHSHRAAVGFDADATDHIENTLNTAGIRTLRLPTIAGHDAVSLQKICPTSLMFVPSRGGISHAPEEFTSDREMCVGLDAMTLAVSDLLSTTAPRSQFGALHA